MLIDYLNKKDLTNIIWFFSSYFPVNKYKHSSIII